MFSCVTKTRDKGQLLSVGPEKDAELGDLGSWTLHDGREGSLGPLCRVWALKMGQDSKALQVTLDQSLGTCC